MKIIKRLLLAFIALIGISIAAVAVALLVIDPNQYKPMIEETVKTQTGLELSLGDIQWQLFPSIGLKLANISLEDTTINDESARTLVSADQAAISVALMPLFKGSVEVGALSLRQPQVKYVTLADDTTNWDTLLKKNSETESPTQSEQSKPSLEQFSVKQIVLEDARIVLQDKKTHTTTAVDAFTLELNDVALGQAITVKFKTQLTQGDTLAADLSGTGSVIASRALNVFTLPELKLTSHIKKAPGLATPQTLELNLAAEANLEKNQAQLSTVTLKLGELLLTAQANVEALTDNPTLTASVSLDPLNARQWLKKTLGVELPPMQNPDALSQVLLNTHISARNLTTSPVFKLEPFNLTIDKSTLKGALSYALNTQAINADLALNSIKLDSYLPPKDESQPNTPSDTTTGQHPQSSDESLIPVDIIRPLNAIVNIRAKEIIYDKTTVNDLLFKLKANKGLVELQSLNAQLFGGSLASSGTLDVTGKEPKIKLNHQVKALKVHALLSQFISADVIDGLASFDLSLNTTGNRVSDLTKGLTGKSQISLQEGLLKGVNLTQMAHTQLVEWSPLIASLVPKDYASKVPPAAQKNTQIQQLLANLQVRDGKIVADTLSAKLSDSELSGQGSVDMSNLNGQALFNLKLSEKLTNPTLAKLSWPITCQGGLTQSFGCQLDSKPVRKQIETMVKNVAEDKAKSALTQKLQEKLGTEHTEATIKEDAKKKLDEEKERASKKVNEKINEKIKGKFGDLF